MIDGKCGGSEQKSSINRRGSKEGQTGPTKARLTGKLRSIGFFLALFSILTLFRVQINRVLGKKGKKLAGNEEKWLFQAINQLLGVEGRKLRTKRDLI